MRPALALAAFLAVASASNPPPARDRFLDGSGYGPALRVIPAMTFSMGSDPAEPGYFPNQTRHTVALSGFAIGVYEITNGEFCRFLREEKNRGDWNVPWAYTNPHRGGQIRQRGGDFQPAVGKEDFPVVAVTWRGALGYCRWLSKKTGREYSLPTAAQWEAAARGGTESTWPWGGTFDPRAVRCRRPGEAEEALRVGSTEANPWGLYDMLGNVWEWVRDCFDVEFYHFAPEKDPVLWNPGCLTPEIRGGSFRDGGDFCRPGYRASVTWSTGQDGIGFRVARVGSAR